MLKIDKIPTHASYTVTYPTKKLAPIILSVPHSGLKLSSSFIENSVNDTIRGCPDTDWFVDELYDFAEVLGIPTIKAEYSRYIIDLNRPLSADVSLYANPNRVTGLIPKKSFDGELIYPEDYIFPGQEVQQRIEQYYQPYYQAIHWLLAEARTQHDHVLLYDAHSIRNQVALIQTTPFPDFMPGNRQGLTCPQQLLDIVQTETEHLGYRCVANNPFHGGNITRSFSAPEKGIFSIQMELNQNIYMNKDSRTKNNQQWEIAQSTLKIILTKFINYMNQLNQSK